MPSRQLVVSVHDVAPKTHARVEQLLEMLAAVGVGYRSLLVIPNFRGEAHLTRTASSAPGCASAGTRATRSSCTGTSTSASGDRGM